MIKRRKKKDLRAVNNKSRLFAPPPEPEPESKHPMSQARVREDAARMEREAGLTGKEVGETA